MIFLFRSTMKLCVSPNRLVTAYSLAHCGSTYPFIKRTTLPRPHDQLAVLLTLPPTVPN
jgi:hypothetical protein